MADITNPLIGGMFDSTSVVETPGGFPRGNKAVDSDFFAKMISSFYSDGVLYGDSFAVAEAGGMNISVSPGIAWAKGRMALMEDTYTAALSAGKQYDAVIRLNSVLGEFELIITDEIASLPVRSASTHDLIIAEINIPAGTTSITAQMISDTRSDNNKCGFVKNAVDALGVAHISEDSEKLGGSLPSTYMKKEGGTMTGALYAAADATGSSLVRNISYGETLPSSLANGEIFILV